LDFLRSMHTETLYLVGDIIDVWSLKKSFFWPQSHDAVVCAILAMAKRGTRVIYIPGNHDQELREFAGLQFGNIEIRCEAIHETADGKRLLVMHGDEFAAVIPSLTNTFGLVMLEAMACGVPVAAFPVTGPVDVVRPGVTGSLNTDLAQATQDALQMKPDACRDYAL
jgi:hypothetical protein